MTQIYKLLEDKVYWFRKYLACTEAFLLALKHAPEIAIGELEFFHGNRESLLKILDSLDVKIQAILAQEERKGTDYTTEQSTKIQYHLREKDSIVEKIVLIDKEVMAEIEVVRVQAEDKLKLLAKGKKALSKYKSTSSHNERIDKRV